MAVIIHAKLRLGGVVREARPQLQIRAVRFEEMARGTTLCPPIETMATQLLEMAEATLELKKLDGHAVAELQHLLTPALKYEVMVRDSTQYPLTVMMETPFLVMVVAIHEVKNQDTLVAEEQLRQQIRVQKFVVMVKDITP